MSGYGVIFPDLIVVKGKSLEFFALNLNGDDIIFPNSAPFKSTNSTKEKSYLCSSMNERERTRLLLESSKAFYPEVQVGIAAPFGHLFMDESKLKRPSLFPTASRVLTGGALKSSCFKDEILCLNLRLRGIHPCLPTLTQALNQGLETPCQTFQLNTLRVMTLGKGKARINQTYLSVIFRPRENLLDPFPSLPHCSSKCATPYDDLLLFCPLSFRTSSSLWGTFIHSKYKLKAALINNLQAPLSFSHTWRRVLQIKDKEDHHIGVLVRNGLSSYWHDHWLPCGRLGCFGSEDCRQILLQHSPWPVHLQQDQQDIYIWKLTSSGSFNLSSTLEVISKGFSSSFSCKSIWHKEIPLSISIFISFGFSLASRFFCKSLEESIDHAFLHCSLAYYLWIFFSDVRFEV
ncbi:hypothetical protein M9H77_35920 [Catharanthus roseus]|uniref:Uncharacterized protein n=1 Tax=Catharanthus roseus TaxID=4058 RepID=A0ACB9ZU21_CATRO|nr:hypothetical protein M9H77_35920 [Catharanthus roseus]